MEIGPVISRLLIAIVTMVVIVGLALSLMRGRARAIRNPELEAQCGAAGFSVTTTLLGIPEVSGTLHDTPFVMTATPGAHTTPAMTVIRIPNAPGVNFAIVREASRDLSGRDLVESMFPDLKSREAVRALFGLGYDTIARRGQVLSATRTFKAEVLRPEALSAAVAQLALIRAATDVQAAPSWMIPSAGSIRIAVASLVLMTAGVLLFALGRGHGWGIVGKAWPGILAAYLLLAVLAVLLLRGRPLARGEMGFVVFMGLPGLILGGCGIAMMAG